MRKGPIADKDLKVFPVDLYPYMIRISDAPPRYARSHNEALGILRTGLEDMAHQFRNIDSQISARCVDAILEVNKLPMDGGRVEQKLDEVTGITYRSELVLRTVDG